MDEVQLKNRGSAVICFYRPNSMFSAGVTNEIWVGDSLCAMANNSAYKIIVLGQKVVHIYSVRSDMVPLRLDIEMGKTYYIRFSYSIRLTKGHRLELVDEETGVRGWDQVMRFARLR